MLEPENCPPTDAGRSEPISSAPGIEFHVDEAGIVRTTMRGTLTVEDLIAHALARAAAGVLPSPQVLDAREARFGITTEDVKRIAAVAKELRRRGPIGPSALVASEDYAYGMARMFATYDTQNHGSFAVFRTMAEAEAWLAG